MKRAASCFLLFTVILNPVTLRAQSTPSLNEIVGNVKANTLPQRGYSVDITQTINAPKGTPMATSIAAGTMFRQNTFGVVYTPKEGLRLNTPALAKQPTTQSASQPLSSPQTGTLKVTVDLPRIFETSNEWQNVSITNTLLNGSECFLITGQDNILDFKIWVNAVDSYVSRFDTFIQGKEFSETDIQYERVDNTCWLPSQIVIHHALDGSQVSQQFGQYLFQ